MSLDRKTLYAILVICLLIFLLLFDIQKFIPRFYNYIPLIWIVSIFFDVYEKKKYLKNKPETEIKVRDKNNSYTDILPFIFGFIIIIFSVIGFFIIDNEKEIAVLYFISGLVMLFQGIITVPNAVIKYENEILKFENGNKKENIEIKLIKDIEVSEDQINVKYNDDKKFLFQHLELNQSEIKMVNDFFKKYIVK